MAVPQLPPSAPQAASGIPRSSLPETRAYRFKRKVLGEPLVNEALSEERLPNPIALGVLAPDCISSTAYGSEEILNILVPVAGVAAFSLVVPLTLGILVILFFVTLSYREVVMVYTKAGGSYVVARDNFGLNVAQIAAVALLIDYVVTVAVQSAAGTNALTSAVPSLTPYQVPITIGVVVLLVYGNLRGIREAGRAFALPTYLFIAAVASVVVVGIVKDLISGLPHVALKAHALVQEPQYVGHTGSGHGLLMGVAVFYVLKSFANGGASLTGLEAISNGVGAFQPPEGRNARKVLVIMSCTLGTLVLGVSVLAHITHATPYAAGTPTVLSQEAKVVFGTGGFGSVIYYIVQLATLLILYTGANTSFNGFPFLASFVAEDRFLPYKLTKRGHRLVFSNGIIILAVVSITLLLVTRANVNSLVAVYAIGVFTGFTLAGAGMVKHHITEKEPAWRRKLVINGFASFLSFAVVIIFAVTKFTEGAWVVVILFPIMWIGLTRLNKRYRLEASVLGETVAEAAAEAKPLPRAVALMLVDRMDLATARAIQYAKTLNVDELRAVHFSIDTTRAARLQERWVRLGLTRLPLELIDCPDRRVIRACLELVEDYLSDGRTEVNVLLPRRSYKRAYSRFLHDATGERLAAAVSRLPHVNATIVPFDVDEELRERRRAKHELRSDSSASAAAGDPVGARHGHGHGGHRAKAEAGAEANDGASLANLPGVRPIVGLQPRQRARVAGRIRSLTVQPWGSVPTLECVIDDDRGRLVVAFLGRRQIAGIQPGARIIVEGTVTERKGKLTIINPTYEFAAANPA
ncbi:amino acid permease [Acidiferrimicrobium sp. IK]|uniref:amino acid permease n=1 Tax=Acidiferrimicrobium sp. IK TaxID=2871700 RepID=UPI0021CAEA0F|nr:amino acid permease [Acidiferrimicrobium sp. IK]MCU4185891.1 amino acid permease [Acidiferrimicrobium sp. IK]